MPHADSALDAAQMAKARKLAATPRAKARMWPAVCAAAFVAVSALALATAMIVAPAVTTTHISQDLAGRP